MELYNDCGIEHMKTMEPNSVDLFVLDLPYANKKFGKCTAMGWDTPIDLDEMWVQIKRVMKPSAVIVHFCNVKFGYALIHSNPKWFRYDLIWKKSRKVGFLSANKQPLRQHENIYLFADRTTPEGIYHPQKELREKELKMERKGENKETEIYGKHTLPDESTYTHRHPTSVIDHENMYVFKKESGTYNPQKTEGKPYDKGKKKDEDFKGGYYKYGDDFKYKPVKNDGYRHPTSIIDAGMIEGGYYRGENGKPFKRSPPNKDGIRHPTSIIDTKIENTILEHNNPSKSIHKTQKPVSLLEWLIKSYSNEGDVVMDFCMGSGTAGVACLNTNRHFIGVERDEEIFNLASNRIENHEIKDTKDTKDKKNKNKIIM